MGFLVLASPAMAAPARVAIVNLAADQEAGQGAARRLRAALQGRDDLSPTPPGDLSQALEQALPDPPWAETQLSRAHQFVAAARDARARFAESSALAALAAAEDVALALEPGPQVSELLAEVSLERGLLAMARSDLTDAVAAFRTLRRLAPQRAGLDPARYPPQVVAAYGAAAEPAKGTTAVEISTLYDGIPVLVDGAPAGNAPVKLELTPGHHYVAAIAPQYAPTGQRIDVHAGAPLVVHLPLSPLPAASRVRRTREQLAGGNGAEELRQAAELFAAQSAAEHVILLRGTAGALSAAVYGGTPARLGGWRPLTDDVSAWLAHALPRRVPAVPLSRLLQVPAEPRTAQRPWYRRPWPQAAMGGGVALTVLGIVLAVLSDEGDADSRQVTWGGFEP